MSAHSAVRERSGRIFRADGGGWQCSYSPIMAVTVTDPIKILFAILLPPVGVFMEVGLGGHFWLNILLTLLGFVPGIIHALWVILSK